MISGRRASVQSADVDVRRRARMRVDGPAVVMHVRRAALALPGRDVDRARAEPDEHQGDTELEGFRSLRGHRRRAAARAPCRRRASDARVADTPAAPRSAAL